MEEAKVGIEGKAVRANDRWKEGGPKKVEKEAEYVLYEENLNTLLYIYGWA